MLQRFDRGIQSHHFRRLFYHLIGDGIVIEGDLVLHCSRNHMEGLLHIAELLSFLLVREPICRLALNQSLTGIRAIES